jgi:hypothetical protein
MLRIIPILLFSTINPGDIDHANATVTALRQLVPTEIALEKEQIVAFNLETTSIAEVAQAYQSQILDGNAHYVLIAAGEPAGKVLEHLLNEKAMGPNSYVYWGTHQYSDRVSALAAKVDQLLVPEPTLDTLVKEENVRRAKRYTASFAVPSSITPIEQLKPSPAWLTKNKLTLDGDYMIVTLPGDAPDPRQGGKQKLFSKDSVEMLFNNVVNLWEHHGKKHTILVQNSPRTGKFNTDGNIVGTHKYHTGTPEQAIDEVSQYFLALLKKAHETKSLPFKFFNFAWEMTPDGREVKHSDYNELLYLATHGKDNIAVLPGESVTDLGKLPLYLEPQQVIVFKPDSMNDDHRKIFDAGFKRGWLSAFAENGTVLYPSPPQKRHDDDATLAAKEILEGIKVSFSKAAPERSR